MKRFTFLLLCVISLFIGFTGSMSHAASLPSVTVGGVSVNAGSAVCRSNYTGSVAITASVSATFDDDIGPTVTSTTCDPCRPGTTGNGNNNCGTGNSGVKSKKTVVTQKKVYTNKQVLGSASDNNGNSNSPAFDVGTTSGTGDFGNLPDGSEGKTTVSANAQALETETVTDTTTITYWSGGPTGSSACTGSNPINGPAPSDTITVNAKASGIVSASGSYLVDLVGPTVTPGHPGFFNNPSSIMQTGSELVHMQIDDGSAGTPWSVTVTATGPDSNIITATENGTFGSSPDGIKDVTNPGPFTLPSDCETPVGTYTVTAKVNTQDLCGNAYDEIDVTGDPFTVTLGSYLVAQTGVLSQLTSGEYGIDQCFVDSVKQTGKKLIVNNTPGSVHIETIITTAGPCAGIGTISGVNLTLTLPDLGTSSGFSYDVTGASPNAHIFVGDGSGGFDLHNGTPLTEVTDLVTQNTSGQTITIDLSNLGDIPATYTIFARAHARFNATTKAGQPAADSPFKFTSSASADGYAGSSDYYISGNPTQLMDNLTGALLGGSESCDANGLFTP